MAHPAGESNSDAPRLAFDRRLKPEFHGCSVTRCPTISPTSCGRWALPEAVKHWSLTSLRDKLVKIGARIVTPARHVTFQMAEVAVPSQLFEEILRLIEGLRPRTAPA